MNHPLLLLALLLPIIMDAAELFLLPRLSANPHDILARARIAYAERLHRFATSTASGALAMILFDLLFNTLLATVPSLLLGTRHLPDHPVLHYGPLIVNTLTHVAIPLLLLVTTLLFVLWMLINLLYVLTLPRTPSKDH